MSVPAGALWRSRADRVLGTLAAFAELRARLLWRRMRGRAGVPELVARVVIWLAVIPLGILFGLLTGSAAYYSVRAGTGMRATLSATTLFFGVWTAWTSLSLTMTERETIDLRRYLVYPIAPWKLTAYGLVASVLGDPFSFFWCLMLGGAFVGAAVARPGAWVLLLALAHLLFAVAVVAMTAAMQEVLARLLRRRGFRTVGIAAIYGGLAGLAAWTTAEHRSPWDALRLLGFLRYAMYPAYLAEGGVIELYAGHVARALPWIAGLAAAGIGTAWAAHRMALASALSGETGGARAAATGAAGWRLPGRLGGALEKEGKYLLRNPLTGVLALVTPVMAGVVAWKLAPRIPPEAGDAIRMLPLVSFAMYAHLVTEVFYLNAFGWERGGGRLWFLAPVRPERVLLAKNAVAYACSLALFALGAVAFVAVGGPPPPWGLPAALALHAGAAPWVAGAGNLVSILNPRPLPFTLQGGGSLSPLSTLAGVTILSGVAGIFSLPALVAIRLESPALLLAGWTALGLAGAAVYAWALPRAGALLVARREALLDAVAGDEG